jgi:DNA-binding GntR family transcriptional regulator
LEFLGMTASHSGALYRGSNKLSGPLTLEAIALEHRDAYTSMQEMAYSVLREAIMSGVLGPGEHLRQEELAAIFGASRVPVRSALYQLEIDGLVEFRPHRGAVVTVPTPEQVEEIYRIRILLETYAIRKAVADMTPERLVHLLDLGSRLDAEANGGRFSELSLDFYNALYDSDRNPTLVTLIGRLRTGVGRFRPRDRMLRHADGHQRLLELIRRKDADGAADWLAAHLSSVAEQLVLLMEQKGGTT